MAVVLNLLSQNIEQGGGGRAMIRRTYSVVFTGSYSATGTTGEPLDFTSTTIFTNTKYIPRARFARNPSEYAVLNSPEGWTMKIEPGSALGTGWGLRLFQSDDAVDPLDEAANGAYAASITGAAGIRVSFAEENV